MLADNEIFRMSENEKRKILARKKAQERIEEEQQQNALQQYRPSAREADIFLQQTPPHPDWLVPGLIERQDRLIITGGPGHGKSTFLRQLAIQFASGIHPFGGNPYPPIKVLLFDLENSERQVHRKIRPLRDTAAHQYAGGLYILVRPNGLDLSRGDGAHVEAEIMAARPDVLITGPIYKLQGGDPNEELTAQRVARWLDGLRTTHNLAVVLEAHSPHSYDPKKPVMRPYGASLWVRWPEFGIHLSEEGELKHWRGPRDEREWPEALMRGGRWPWTDEGITQAEVDQRYPYK
jgi:RecA-family ATPase